MITIEAKDGQYLTQAVEIEEENRIFVRKISGMALNEADWRDATEAEKAEWEAAHQPELQEGMELPEA